MIHQVGRAEGSSVVERCRSLLARWERRDGVLPNARGAGPRATRGEAAGAWRGKSYASRIDQGAGNLDATGGRHGPAAVRRPPLLEPQPPITDRDGGRPEPCRDGRTECERGSSRPEH